ncbi:MAG: type II toxin-antitoxin system Phd/YefM family antitoxin [Sphingomicrobium sp.]
MKLERIKPISYIKANAAEVLRNLAEVREPYIITQNGEAPAVLQDIHSYQATQETLALLKLLAMGHKQVAEGKVRPARDVLDEIKAKLIEKKQSEK